MRRKIFSERNNLLGIILVYIYAFPTNLRTNYARMLAVLSYARISRVPFKSWMLEIMEFWRRGGERDSRVLYQNISFAVIKFKSKVLITHHFSHLYPCFWKFSYCISQIIYVYMLWYQNLSLLLSRHMIRLHTFCIN